jgi:hypothetical protein
MDGPTTALGEEPARSAHLEAVGDANERKHGREEADSEDGEKDEANHLAYGG